MTRLPDILPAYRALLALLRPELSPALVDLAKSLAAPLSEAQRAWLVQRAVQEGAADWLLNRRAEGVLALPPPLVGQLQQAAAQQARRTLETDALRLRLRPLLQGPGAPLVLLKGASIEQRCYPPGVMRHSADVDALVTAEDLPAVQSHLLRLGLPCVRRDPSGRTLQFAGPGAGAALDLHLRLACPRRYPRYGSAEQTKRAWHNAVFLRDGTKVLAPADATLHLLVHLAAGLGGDLRHLADADQWLRKLDPPLRQVLVEAKQLGVIRAVRAAFAWLNQLPQGAVQGGLQVGLQGGLQQGSQEAVQEGALAGTLAPTGADLALAQLQRRLVQGHYLRHGPVLPPTLLALTELVCVDFPRGAVGLAGLRLGLTAGPARP